MQSRRSKSKKSKASKREAESSSQAKSEKGKKLKTEAQSAATKIPQKSTKLEDPSMAKIRSNYRIAEDPNASQVFKSIFTSSDKAKNQTKAHWVTYNPFYN